MKNIIDENGKVKCMECGKYFKQIQYKHLKACCGLTVDEYRKKWPNAILISEHYKNKGEKNPFYGKTHDEETWNKIGEKISDMWKDESSIFNDGEWRKKRNQSLADHNRKKVNDSNYIENLSKGVKKSYENNPDLIKSRSEHMKKWRKENNDYYREKMYEIGKFTRPEDKDDYIRYRDEVRQITEENYNNYFCKIPNAEKRGWDWNLDHKVSIYYGFISNIEPEIIAHYKNLEVISRSENCSKWTGCSMEIEELRRQIYNEQVL